VHIIDSISRYLKGGRVTHSHDVIEGEKVHIKTCNDCGSFVISPHKKINHSFYCRPGQAKWWENHYKRVDDFDDHIDPGDYF
jgi:hypothetical protein